MTRMQGIRHNPLPIAQFRVIALLYCLSDSAADLNEVCLAVELSQDDVKQDVLPPLFSRKFIHKDGDGRFVLLAAGREFAKDWQEQIDRQREEMEAKGSLPRRLGARGVAPPPAPPRSPVPPPPIPPPAPPRHPDPADPAPADGQPRLVERGVSRLKILLWLWQMGKSAGTTEVQHGAGVPRGSISYMLQELESIQLIERIEPPNPTGRPSFQNRLSAAGLEELRANPRTYEAAAELGIVFSPAAASGNGGQPVSSSAAPAPVAATIPEPASNNGDHAQPVATPLIGQLELATLMADAQALAAGNHRLRTAARARELDLRAVTEARDEALAELAALKRSLAERSGLEGQLADIHAQAELVRSFRPAAAEPAHSGGEYGD